MNDEKDVVMEQLLDYVEKKMKEVQVNSFIDGFLFLFMHSEKNIYEGKIKKEIMNWMRTYERDKNHFGGEN